MESSDRFDTYLMDAESDTATEQGTFGEPSKNTDAPNGEQVIDADQDGVPDDIELIDDTIDSSAKTNGQDESEVSMHESASTEPIGGCEADPTEPETIAETVAETETGAELESSSPAEPQVSRFRAASLSVADAIESAVSTSEQRHDHLQEQFVAMASQQAAADDKQRQLSQSVASIQSWQSQSDGRLNQLDIKQRAVIDSQKSISESVNSVLTNQKTSAKCYNDVMAGLNAIQATQQFDQQRLDELTKQFDDRLTALRKSMVVGGVIIGVLAVIAIVVGLV